MVVRFEDSSANEQGEAWWPYRIADGKALAIARPKEPRPDASSFFFIFDAKPVAGTPLTLLHWWRYEPDPRGREGARFTLVGEDGSRVWSMDLPDDYNVSADEVAEKRLRDEIKNARAILRADQTGQFDLRLVKRGQRG